jgi:hypothetical protein
MSSTGRKLGSGRACKPCTQENIATFCIDVCCRLILKDADGKAIYNFNLNDMIYFYKPGYTQLILNDGVTYINLSETKMAALGLTTDIIDEAINACCGGGDSDGGTDPPPIELTGFKTLVLDPNRVYDKDGCSPIFKCIDLSNLSEGDCVTFDSSGGLIVAGSNEVGVNPLNNSKEQYPFTCEFIADGADLVVTMADIIAAQAGGTFQPSGTASDSADAYLNQIKVTLAPLGDEVGDPVVATTACDAVVAYTDTAKTYNMEPGGSFTHEVPLGVDVPPFEVTVADGSAIVLSGCLSIELDKSGVVVPKA